MVSCVYGDRYRLFVKRWAEAVELLNPQPDAVIVATDRQLDIPDVRVVESLSHWRYPQAWYLERAVEAADTDWVWIVDIDDLALPDGLQGLHDVVSDVWQLGYLRSDGEVYLPPRLTAGEFLDSPTCVYVGASMVRTDIFRECGGYPDVAFQDWGLWRRLVRFGASVEPSDRAHFKYMRHPDTRGERELTAKARAEHLAEMMESELAHA